MPNQFLSCDWGTSNFRLRLVSTTDLRVIEEVDSDKGVGELIKLWRAKPQQDEEHRLRFYTEVLREHVEGLKARARDALQGLPMVISGMASSTIGLTNLPYQKLPVPTDGSGLITRSFEPSEALPHKVLLISGLRSEADVMRGEETQLIGCITPEMEEYPDEQLVIHPGTHSKHITIRARQVTGFRTYMSGEFFKLLSTHGILRDNVQANPLESASLPCFEKGVHESLDSNLLHAAFKVRTNDLFQRFSREDNYHYLSGLLVGTELQELKKNPAVKTYLCCGPGLFQQYNTALQVLGLDKKVTVFPPEWEEGSVIRGQAKILSRLNNP